MIRTLSVAALLAVGATLAFAQGAGGAAAIAERKAAMKAVGGATKSVTDMVKGDVPFDAAKAAAGWEDRATLYRVEPPAQLSSRPERAVR